MSTIRVGEKRQIYNPNKNERFCVVITAENVVRINQYDDQVKTAADWRFGDVCDENMQNLGGNGVDSYHYATISFEDKNGVLVPTLLQTNEYNGGRRSRKVKKSKTSKKRPTRRGRSSKARKARKSSKVSKSRTTRRK